MRKYPRTRHVEGSRLQEGDEDLEAVPFDRLRGLHLVVEEKVDGANCAVSFGPGGELRLQSRGHYLAGGPRERHFDLFKSWAQVHRSALERVLEDRFVMYGEWCYARHTVFYNALPHYFLEFDVLDRAGDVFLSTPRRGELLAGLPVVSVPVLHEGSVETLAELCALVGPSRFKTPQWREALREAALRARVRIDRAVEETDPSDDMEGLYIKVEGDGAVRDRLKWIRAGFVQAALESGTHWLERPILANGLLPGVDLFAS